MQRVVKVIYIIAAGRSGSTVLDAVLGNHDAVESVGELINAPRVLDANREYCACGQLAGNCPFWHAVREEWTNITGIEDLPKWSNCQAGFERIRNMPKLLYPKIYKTASFRNYQEGIAALFHGISKVSGKEFIVDSSKNPVRALALSLIPNIDLKIIHLVRDGRGVAWSMKKPYKKDPKGGLQNSMQTVPVWRTAILWGLVNRVAEKSIARIGNQRSMRLRYEDYVTNPAVALSRIGDFIGLDYSSIIEELLGGGNMKVGHTISGNRVRMSGTIRLQPDFSWQDHLTEKEKSVFWLLSGGLAKKYGYRIDDQGAC